MIQIFDLPSKLMISRSHRKFSIFRRVCASSFRFIALGSSQPRRMASQNTIEKVVVNGREYRSVREGQASILAPFREIETSSTSSNKPKNNDEGEQAVFYNPIQQFNRDLSVLAILIYGEGALLEKQARHRKKVQSSRSRRENAAKRKAGVVSNGSNGAPAIQAGSEAPSSKRKLEEVDLPAEQVIAKKQRVEEFDADEDELEVMELEGGAQNEGNIKASPDSFPKGDGNIPVSETNLSNTILSDKSSRKDSAPSFTILDALSATGLRALRYAKEIPFATNVIANDLSPEAVNSINTNITHNSVGDIVHSHVGDARAYMYSKVGNEHQPAGGKYVHRFDVIDLDPYGTAAPFFDAAVQSLQDGGMLCVTCTDAGVFASNGYPEKTYALYGGIPLKGAFSHEAGLRLILHALATSAAKYGIAIEPLLSLSIDFYARLFVRIHKRPKDVKLLAGTTMIVYNCDQGCGAWNTQLVAKNQSKEAKNGDLFYKYGFAQGPSVNPNCDHCGFKMHLGGPMWAGPLHNSYFVQRILDRLPSLDKLTYQTTDRLQGMLTVALEEDLTLTTSTIDSRSSPNTENSESEAEHSNPPKSSEVDQRIIPRTPPDSIDASPFFFIPNYAAKVIHCQTPSEDELRGAIRHLGYRVTRSHCKAGSFRTTAPWKVIWEIYREWVRTRKPIKADAVKPGTAGWAIMSRLRESERKKARERKEGLFAKLGKCESLEDMRTVLEAEMYRFDHPSTEMGLEGLTENGKKNGVDAPQEKVSAATSALPTSSELSIIFDEKLGREKPRGKLVRYQVNPRENWGPMNRAGGGM